jgi:tetratricopeptide (TPR) repeat protein
MWFVMQSSSEPSSVDTTATVASPTGGPAQAGVGHPTPVGQSPFLSTHEQGTSFTPTGENLAPSYHVEVEALTRRLEEAPQDTTMLLRMARLKHDGHRTQEAITYYRRYLDLHPEGRQAWLDLTQCYGELQQWDDAETATEDMLRYFPDDSGALYNLGAIYANTGRTSEARATWEKVVARDADPEMKTLAENALKRLNPAHP